MSAEPDHPLVRAALDLHSYAGHDDDCSNHKDGSCSCGYTPANGAFLDQVERWQKTAALLREDDGGEVRLARKIIDHLAFEYGTQAIEDTCRAVIHRRPLPSPPTQEPNG